MKSKCCGADTIECAIDDGEKEVDALFCVKCHEAKPCDLQPEELYESAALVCEESESILKAEPIEHAGQLYDHIASGGPVPEWTTEDNVGRFVDAVVAELKEEHAGRWLPDHHKFDEKAYHQITGHALNQAADHMRQLEAERDAAKSYLALSPLAKECAALKVELEARDNEIATRYKVTHEDMERLKAENERLKQEVNKITNAAKESYDKVNWMRSEWEGLADVCEKLRAREVDLIVYVSGELAIDSCGCLGGVIEDDQARRYIAEYEESKK